MVMYPTLGGYIDFCKGFTFWDIPWANDAISESFSSLTDASPFGFMMFYLNLNLASTYLLALVIFLAISLVLLALRLKLQPQEGKDFFSQVGATQ